MYSKMLFDVRDNIVLHFKSWMFCYKNLLLISTHPFTNQKFRNKFKFTKFWFAINFIYRNLVSVFTEPSRHLTHKYMTTLFTVIKHSTPISYQHMP